MKAFDPMLEALRASGPHPELADSFYWRYIRSTDDGKTWGLQQEMNARRNRVKLMRSAGAITEGGLRNGGVNRTLPALCGAVLIGLWPRSVPPAGHCTGTSTILSLLATMVQAMRGYCT